jgi:long-chain acyl-CoA synthetase
MIHEKAVVLAENAFRGTMTSKWEQRLGVWAVAQRYPDHPAILVSPSTGELTYGELAARAHRVVHATRAMGVGAGDTVAIALPNDVDILVWQLAGSECGWRYYTIGPNLPAAELTEILEHSGAKVLVAHAANAANLRDVTGPEVRISVGGEVAGFIAQSELVDGQPDSLPTDRRTGTQLVYTSGTTGKKKAIEHPLPTIDPDDAADASKTFGQAFAFEPLAGVHLVSAGMHHGGCRVFYMGALNIGQSLVIMAKFDPEHALQLIEQYSVTTAYMVPTQFVRLLRLPDATKGRYRIDSLSSVVHSAAPCPLEIKKQMMDWWGPVIWETYGGTEGAATIAKPWRWLEKPGTVGRAIRGMRVHIVDDDGKDLPPHVAGMVYMEPEARSFSYYRDDELTAQSYRGRSFTIGDVGYLDEDGYLFIVDRKKDMIISGGVNVYPAEIEAVLVSHPSVADAAVLGQPDPEWGERVCAFVQVAPGVEAGQELAAELVAYVRERLDSYKCPRQVWFREKLPRNEAGKLVKRDLKELIAVSIQDPTRSARA